MSRNRNLVGMAALATLVVISGCAQAPPATQPELNDAAPSHVVEAELHDTVDCRSEPSSWTPETEDSTVDQPIAVPGRVSTGFAAIAAVRCTLEFDLAPVGGPAGSGIAAGASEGDAGVYGPEVPSEAYIRQNLLLKVGGG